MSKWRDDFCEKNSTGMIKEAIRDAKDDDYQKKIDQALTGVCRGDHKRKGKDTFDADIHDKNFIYRGNKWGRLK